MSPAPVPAHPLILSFLLLAIFVHGRLTVITSANQTLIPETCRRCAQGDPNVSYEFCVAALESNPSSRHEKHLRGLGLISMNLLRHNVSNTACYVRELLRSTNQSSDPYTRACLEDCSELYSDSIPTLEEATRAYRAKRYVDANVELSSVMDASTTCEDGFSERKGKRVPSPLARRNNDTFQLSALALSIITSLSR